MITYVDVATARDAKGIRIVVPGSVASPWSEATKGLFRIANIPVLAVRTVLGTRDAAAWTGIDNVPVVMRDAEPARSSWSAIVGLAARLAPTLLPADPAARADAMGLLEMIAGEDGVGWNARLAMVQASRASSGTRGFSPPVADYLARRYGYTDVDVRPRVAAQLELLGRRLGDRALFSDLGDGAHPTALDVYAATFLISFVPISEADCPAMPAPLRVAFGAAAEDLGPLVPASLLALRERMLREHLGWPITL